MSTAHDSRSLLHDRRRLLISIAVVLAVAEFIDAFFISFPEGPAVFATLLLGGAFWVRRGGIAGPILVAVLFAFDLANSPSWPRHSTSELITTIAYAIVSLAGLLVAAAVIKDSVQARRTTASAGQIRA